MSKMTVNRNFTYPVDVQLVVWECPTCGIVYGIPKSFADACRDTGGHYWCPNGHQLSWHETETDRLRKKLEVEQARRVALDDRLHAAEAEAERTRRVLIRDRHRFANGVCPCCNRSFENVARHMQSQHPDYDPAVFVSPGLECSCGRSFKTPRGLVVHQSRMRPDNWLDPTVGSYWRHLTVTS